MKWRSILATLLTMALTTTAVDATDNAKSQPDAGAEAGASAARGVDVAQAVRSLTQFDWLPKLPPPFDQYTPHQALAAIYPSFDVQNDDIPSSRRSPTHPVTVWIHSADVVVAPGGRRLAVVVGHESLDDLPCCAQVGRPFCDVALLEARPGGGLELDAFGERLIACGGCTPRTWFDTWTAPLDSRRTLFAVTLNDLASGSMHDEETVLLQEGSGLRTVVQWADDYNWVLDYRRPKRSRCPRVSAVDTKFTVDTVPSGRQPPLLRIRAKLVCRPSQTRLYRWSNSAFQRLYR